MNSSIAERFLRRCVPLEKANFSDVNAIYIILAVNEDLSWSVIDGEIGAIYNVPAKKKVWEGKCNPENIWICKMHKDGI